MARVKVTLADGSERSLCYSLAALKRIKQRFAAEHPPKEGESENFLQHPVMQALAKASEEAIPYLLMEGIVEKEGLTEARIAEELVEGPMLDSLALKVIEAFFGQRQAAMLQGVREMQEAAVKKMVDQAMAALTPAAINQTVN